MARRRRFSNFLASGLPKGDETGAYRLLLAVTALKKGVSPIELMKALGFSRAARDLEKYNPDQPRVPAGSGRMPCSSAMTAIASGSWKPPRGPTESAPRRFHS